MAHFTFQGDRISKKTISVAKDVELTIAVWGTAVDTNPSDELKVVSSSTSTVTVRRSDDAIKDTIREWILKGISRGKAEVTAKNKDEVWDTITVEVVDSAELMFIQNLYMEAANVALEFKLPISIMLAQACLESGYGKNPRALAHNTLYGITKRSELSKGKERDWYPTCKKIIPSPTQVEREVEENGVKKKKLVVVSDRFCGASSYKEAVRIWGEYVTKHPHTNASLFRDPPWDDTYRKALGELMKRLGFGTKLLGDYTQDMMKIIDTYNLRQYDPK